MDCNFSLRLFLFASCCDTSQKRMAPPLRCGYPPKKPHEETCDDAKRSSHTHCARCCRASVVSHLPMLLLCQASTGLNANRSRKGSPEGAISLGLCEEDELQIQPLFTFKDFILTPVVHPVLLAQCRSSSPSQLFKKNQSVQASFFFFFFV